MKLAIIGSRTFGKCKSLCLKFDLVSCEPICPLAYKLLCRKADELNPTEIVSGGAKGADTLAERYADERNLLLKVFLPKFKRDPAIPYHPKYFFERNIEIVEYANMVLAFPEGEAKGTRHAINYANKIGRPVHIVPPGTPLIPQESDHDY